MSAIPEHWVHIYQRPAQGTNFIARQQAFKYQHQKLAVGGDDTMSCEFALDGSESQMALENWVGCRVAVFVDNPMAPIWEGLISRIYYDDGTLMVTRSLDEMFNRVEMIVTSTTDTLTTIVAAADELDSQALYGVKSGTCDGFVRRGTVAQITPQMDAVRDLIINQVAWPLTSVSQSGGAPMFRMEAVGFYHTLSWNNYYKGTFNMRIPSAYIYLVLGAADSSSIFFDGTDASLIQTNAAYQIPDSEMFGKTVWQCLQSAQGGGDGSAYWVMGITHTDPITGTRRFYYRPGQTDVYYTSRTIDGLRPRNQWGGLVRPWAMEADRVMRVNDLLVGWSGRGLDPRETYIETLRYDAESQKVTWAGADNLHMQGALQTHRYYKMQGPTFGPPQRNAWT
jgi:hypothetical protein